MPAAPATQPSPNSGTRLTSGRKPSRSLAVLPAGNGEPSDRRREHDVDLGRLDFGLCECRLQCSLTQLECDVKVGVVGFGEAAELAVSRQRQRGGVSNPTGGGESSKLWTGEMARADITSSWLCRCGGNSTATAATDGVPVVAVRTVDVLAVADVRPNESCPHCGIRTSPLPDGSMAPGGGELATVATVCATVGRLTADSGGCAMRVQIVELGWRLCEILVTGATGYVGSRLVTALLRPTMRCWPPPATRPGSPDSDGSTTSRR